MTGSPTLTPDQVRELAAAACGDCAWYHGFWPLIRALGFGTVPEDHAGFYRDELRAVAAKGPIGRVLVCAAADHSMPLLVQRVAEELGQSPEITVLDRCETPLVLSRREFGGASVRLTTVLSPVLDAKLESPFDVIVTHSFLGYFSEAERPALLARWAAWLRPGGRAVTVNRLRETARHRIGFSETEASAFVARIVAAVAARPGITALAETDLRARAADYARRFSIHPLTSIADLTGQCRNAGLAARVVPLGQVSRSGPTGPTAPGSARYFGFSLERTDTTG